MKILLVEDHPVFREGLTHVLRGLDERVEIVEVSSADAAIAMAARHEDISVILLDLKLPGMDGLSALAPLRERYPGVPLLVVSASEDRDDVRRSIRAGANGYVTKTASPDVLLGAVRAVLAGTVYVPTVMLQDEEPGGGMPGTRVPEPHGLTDRELEVLRLVCAGKPNKGIARELGISDGTVRIHLTSIFRALGVASRTQAIVAAQRRRMFEN